MIAVFIGTLAVLLIVGTPIAVALLGCAIALMIYLNMFDVSIISQQIQGGINSFPLMAIPFFMLAGEFMARGGLSKRIVSFADILMGRFKGGLGYVVVLACMIFAGLSGSAIADAAAMGSLMIPMMMDSGYSKEDATGLICSSSIIAPIIPPSIPMILIGTSVGLSISRLFIGGLIPGIIIGLCLMARWFFVARKRGYSDTRSYTVKEAIVILRDSVFALFMPVIIIVGIRFGIFTPTEAGAIAVVYAFLISKFIYREVNFKDVVSIILASIKMSAMVMLIVAAATVAGWMFTVGQFPAMIIELFSPLIDKPMILLILINLLLLILGMVMDITPNVLIFSPVLFPLITAAGIDPYYFGILMTYNLCIGLITPPVGAVLYIGSSVGKASLQQVVKGVWPFLTIELVVLALFIAFPQLITIPLDILMK